LRDSLRTWARLEPVDPLHGIRDPEVSNGQHIGPVQPEHQEHLRGPAAESLHRGQPFHHDIVSQCVDVVEAQTPVGNATTQILDVRRLLAAQTDRPKLFDGDAHYRRGIGNQPVGKEVAESSEDRRGRFARKLLAHNRPEERRQMIGPLPLGHAARPEPRDDRSQLWIAPDEIPPRLLVLGRRQRGGCGRHHRRGLTA
jgi:hypothetical protein